MKKTWSIFSVAVLLALSLVGCAGDKTQKTGNDLSADPTNHVGTGLSSRTTRHIPGTADSGDLAGADGIVGSTVGIHRTGDNALERAGDGIRNTLDDMGDGVRNAVDDLGDAARDAGRDAKGMIESH